MNLYEITAEYKRLQNELENGEDVSGILELINDALEVKADNYAKVIRNLEAQVEAFKAEEDRMAKSRKRCNEGIERLKDNLYQAMKATGKEKFNTDLFKFSIQKNGGKAPVIVKVTTDKLPDELVIISEKPDTDAIRKYIEETGDLTYAEYGERGETLRIK